VATEWAAAEAAHCAASRSVYQTIDVERNAGALPAKTVEAHFFHPGKIHWEGPADAAAGLPFVVAEFEAALPLSFEAARRVSSEAVVDAAVSISGPRRCLCFVGGQQEDEEEEEEEEEGEEDRNHQL
jgi:hypothetical protein